MVLDFVQMITRVNIKKKTKNHVRKCVCMCWRLCFSRCKFIFLLMHLIWQRRQGRETIPLVASAIPCIKLLITSSMNCRIGEWLRLEGASEDDLVQLLCSKQSQLQQGWIPAGF